MVCVSVKGHNPLARNFSNEELKMKKLLLNLLVLLSKDVAALQVSHTLAHFEHIESKCDICVFLSQLYKEEKVMGALLILTKPPAASSERRSGSRHWSSVQQEELQLQALATLATVAPLMLEDFMSCQGNSFLLLLLDWCIKQGETGD